MKVCQIPECGGKHRAKGYCTKHYQRLLKHGDVHATARPRGRVCEVEGCEKPHNARGYCSMHYASWERYGDPLATKTTRHRPDCVLCSRKHHARGLCFRHYDRFNKYGDPFYDGTPVVCKVPDCLEPKRSRGYCDLHYYRWRRYGDPLAGRAPEGTIAPMGEELDLAPLWDLIVRRGGLAEVCAEVGIEYESTLYERVDKWLYRARAENGWRIDVAYVDYIAVKILRSHPALVYGDAWWTPEVCEDEEPWGVAA